MNNGKLYFNNLDSIRFIAALMVYFHHGINYSFEYLPIKNTYFDNLVHTIGNGKAGVSIFFVLSGFLITYNLITEYEFNKKNSLKNFYIRRVFRVWPLYFLIISFTFVIYPFLKTLINLNNPLGSNFWYHISFLSNFDVVNICNMCKGSNALSQDITWSVSVEEQFYLFWPLIFVFLNKRFWIFSIIGSILLSVIFRFINYDNDTVLYFHTMSVLLDLAIGGLLAYLIKESARIRIFFENTSSISHLIFFSISFLLIFFVNDINSFKYGDALGRVFITISFALIIGSQAITKSNSKLNLENISFARRLGKYTYGMYLIHPIAMLIIDIIVRLTYFPKESFINSFLIGIVGLILTLILSKLSYVFFESKFLSLKEKFTVIK